MGGHRPEGAAGGAEEAVPGPSVFPSGEPGVSGDFWAPSASQLLAFSPGKEQAAGVWDEELATQREGALTFLAMGWGMG